MAPLVVLEGPEEALGPAVEELRRQGWDVRWGFALGEAEWDVARRRALCAGVLREPADAAAALIAAARGAGLAVVLAAEPAVADRFLEDLRHLGPVDFGPAEAAQALGPEQAQLLGLLAEGLSLAEAAGRLYVSLRTAERRLAAARRTLGVASTAEALLALRRREASSP